MNSTEDIHTFAESVNRKQYLNPFHSPHKQDDFSVSTHDSLLFSYSSITFLIWATWLHGKLNTATWNRDWRETSPRKALPLTQITPLLPCVSAHFHEEADTKEGFRQVNYFTSRRIFLSAREIPPADVQLKPKCLLSEGKAQYRLHIISRNEQAYTFFIQHDPKHLDILHRQILQIVYMGKDSC